MTSAKDRKPPPQRQPSQEKHARILDAAMRVFLERGYDGASVDEIALAADVAKQTIYNHFGDKASLFHAICIALTEQVTFHLILQTGDHRDVKSVLERVARTYLDVVLHPTSLALHRILISKAVRFPELGPAIYNVGGARFIRSLGNWLAERTRRGELCAADAEAAAENFFALVKGNRQVRALLGVPVEQEGLAREKAVRRAVHAFLRAYGN